MATSCCNLYKILGYVDESCTVFRGVDPEFLPHSFTIHVEAKTKERAIYAFLKHYPDLTFKDIRCVHIGSLIVCKEVDYLTKSEILPVVKPFLDPVLL